MNLLKFSEDDVPYDPSENRNTWREKEIHDQTRECDKSYKMLLKYPQIFI